MEDQNHPLYLKDRDQVNRLLAIEIPNEKNSFKLNEIGKSCKLLSIDYLKIKNVNELVRFIGKSEERFFLITGSLYLVGKVRNRFL